MSSGYRLNEWLFTFPLYTEGRIYILSVPHSTQEIGLRQDDQAF